MVLKNLEESTNFIREKMKSKPRLGVVLGSGLGGFASEIEVDYELPFSEIPCFLPPSVEGHSGKLVLGECQGVPVAILQGRTHYYEGHSMEQVAHPVRTLAMLGIEVLMLTNSAGGLNPAMKPGDFMVIEDHINLMGMNPLMGPNLKKLGPRFPDMTEAYDKKLQADLISILKEKNFDHHRGVYCGVSGPTYETPAEVNFLKVIGGSAVGMSTVPETIAANHLGLRVCAVSCITNLASGLSQEKLNHEDVTEIAGQVEAKMATLIKEFLRVTFH